MKKLLPILLLTLTVISCTHNLNHPRCSDKSVQSALKLIYSKNVNRDTDEIFVSKIDTKSDNDDLKTCQCAAHIFAEGKLINSFYLRPIDGYVYYLAQLDNSNQHVDVSASFINK